MKAIRGIIEMAENGKEDEIFEWSKWKPKEWTLYKKICIGINMWLYKYTTEHKYSFHSNLINTLEWDFKITQNFTNILLSW